MKSKFGWSLAIILGLAILFLLPSLFMGRFWWNGHNIMMGGYNGMMGGLGYMMFPFGFLGMALMWLIPLGVLVLLVMGSVALINGLNRSGGNQHLRHNCPNCGKPAQADWSTCPYCGKGL